MVDSVEILLDYFVFAIETVTKRNEKCNTYPYLLGPIGVLRHFKNYEMAKK